MQKIIGLVIGFLYCNTFFILPHFYTAGTEGTWDSPVFEYLMVVGLMTLGAYTFFHIINDITS